MTLHQGTDRTVQYGKGYLYCTVMPHFHSVQLTWITDQLNKVKVFDCDKLNRTACFCKKASGDHAEYRNCYYYSGTWKGMMSHSIRKVMTAMQEGSETYMGSGLRNGGEKMI